MSNKVVFSYLLAAFFAWFAPSASAATSFDHAAAIQASKTSQYRGYGANPAAACSSAAGSNCTGSYTPPPSGDPVFGSCYVPNSNALCTGRSGSYTYYFMNPDCPANTVKTAHPDRVTCTVNEGYTAVQDSTQAAGWRVEASKSGTCAPWETYNESTNSCEEIQCGEGAYYSGIHQQCSIIDCNAQRVFEFVQPSDGVSLPPLSFKQGGCSFSRPANDPTRLKTCVHYEGDPEDKVYCRILYDGDGPANYDPVNPEGFEDASHSPEPFESPNPSAPRNTDGTPDTDGNPNTGTAQEPGGGDTGGGDTGGGDTGGGDTGGGDTGGGDTGGGDTGGGDTGGGEDGTGDCEEYDCATEATLKRIADGLEGDYDATVVDSEIAAFDGEIQAHEESLAQSAETMWFAFFESGPIASLYDGYEQLNPLSKFSGSNCSFSLNVGGVDRVFSYCDEQDTIHTILGFCLFCFLILSVRDLIFERPGGAA